MNLAELLASETDRVEWKQSLSDTDGMLKAVCALANNLGNSRQPGYLVIGVRKDGSIVGVPRAETDWDQCQQEISNRLRSTNLLPHPSIQLSRHRIEQEWLVVLEVAPHDVPPIVEVDGKAYVRVGSTTRQATTADLQRLGERRPDSMLPFDLRPVAHGTLDDLRINTLNQMYEADKAGDQDGQTYPSLEQWLTQKQLGREVNGVWRPNTAAILLYGVNPQAFYPGAMIEFVRYAAKDADADVISRKSIGGTLADQLEVVWTQLQANVLSVPASDKSSGIREVYADQYPLDALRELARNMVQHRQYDATHAPSRIEWYADCIEFSNPGRPYGRASDGEFGAHSDYRNPTVTARLVELGYVERLGRGIRRVQALLNKNGNPPLEHEIDGFTRVIVRARR